MTVVEARAYSPGTGSTSDEREMSTSGSRRATLSRTMRS